MKIQRLIDRFNEPDVHLVVSEWPSREPGVAHHGVAAYTRETLTTLAKDRKMRFVVLSETNDDNRPQVVANGNIAVFRIFDQHRRRLYPQILLWLAKFPAIRHVTVHSEFGAYTGLAHFLLLIPFLLLIKATGRRVTYVAHNVVDSLETFAPYLNITNDKHLHNVLSYGIGIYYGLLGAVADQIVSLDAQSHKRLAPYVRGEKLTLIPHWVKLRPKTRTKKSARELLGLPANKKIILSFGFISWYKGSDALARLFASEASAKESHLVFAGGKHIVRQHNAHYQEYFERFLGTLKSAQNVTLTGFLPEDKIRAYFAAADLVVFPYRGLLGGSGALSWAIGCGKPFLISEDMRAFLANPDIHAQLASILKSPQDVLFTLDKPGMKKIVRIAHNPKALRTLAKLSVAIGKTRNIHDIGKSFYNEVYAPTPAGLSAFRLLPS
jgi:glycosyltransferase involved in cell wall biosynthesis